VLHLIVFSHLRWDFVYQRPQQLLSRLARHYAVVFVEEPVRCQAAQEAWLECRETVAGVVVVVPHTSVHAGGFSDEQLDVLRPLLSAYLRHNGIAQYVAWFYTPLAAPLLESLEPRAVVFDCMDELSAFKGAPPKLRERERALMDVADIVLTGGPSLYEARRSLHPNVMCLPSAVDGRHYSPHARRSSESLDLAARLQGHVPRPRLGYIGVIDERIDIELIAALADADRGWHIVMVGPVVKIDQASLPQRPNIVWLGLQPYGILPPLVLAWDVCLLPFALNEATRYISPTKALEYMAAHKPIVGTPVHDVVTLHGDVVRVGLDAASFIEACRQTLAEDVQTRKSRIRIMRERVGRCSWDAAADRIHRAIESAMGMKCTGSVDR
jgi:UDP-galactopyranose mutase